MPTCHVMLIYADGFFIYNNFNHLYNPANDSILFVEPFSEITMLYHQHRNLANFDVTQREIVEI